MKWMAQIFRNWSFVVVFISIVFLWYYFTFTPTNQLNSTLALTISIGAIIAYITHSTLQGIRIEQSLREINSSVRKGFDFRIVKDRDEFLKLLKDSILHAEHRICVTHFDPLPPEKPFRSEERAQYWRTNYNVIMKDSISFTRLISLDNQQKVKWVKEQCEEFKNCGKYNILAVQLGEHKPVVMDMLVVDNKMAMLWPSTHARDEVYIWITGRSEFVGAFQSCFDAMVNRAICLKDGRTIYEKNINQFQQLES